MMYRVPNNFLQGAGVNVQGSGNVINVNLPIPDEYREAFARLMGATPQEVIHAEVTPITPQEEE